MKCSVYAAPDQISRPAFETAAYRSEVGVLFAAVPKDMFSLCTFNIINTVLSEARPEAGMASGMRCYTMHGRSRFGIWWALWSFGVSRFQYQSFGATMWECEALGDGMKNQKYS